MRALLTAVFLLISTTVYAQPKFEQKHTDLLVQYAAKFGLPALNSDVAREWTRNLAEQFLFTFPAENWGHKAAGGGRPPSTDVIARNQGGLWGYDVILNQGAPNQALIPNPGTINLAGQEFIPVTAFNHLGDGGGPNPPPPNPPPVDLGPILKRLAELEAGLAVANSKIAALEVRDGELNKQHFELSDYAREADGKLFTEINLLKSTPIPTGCRARFLGSNVGCSLTFP